MTEPETPSLPLPSTPQPLARLWREGWARLSAQTPPCPGIRLSEWPEMHSSALRFLSEHADRAAELEWTTTELFGVDPLVGAVRPDACGAFTFAKNAPLLAIERAYLDFGNTKFYRHPRRPPSVPIWDWREPKRR